MTAGRIACTLAVLATICVLAIFFFPGIEGPYSTVHGPVTALLSIRSAARLRMTIRAGIDAVMAFRGCSLLGCPTVVLTAIVRDGFPLDIPAADGIAVLRC